MRKAFVSTLVKLAESDDRIVLLTGDLGYTVLEPFTKRFPERFFNVGVAEQNMVGIATGLAEAGFIPFVYSIVPFAVLRPYEFIRNGPILHQLPVRIVGIGGGFEYGSNGMTHYGLEDIGVMRTQPGMTVIAPADHEQAHTALAATWNVPGPVYYRLGKNENITVPGLAGSFELERVQIVHEGDDLLFITMGTIATEVTAAIEALSTQGITCTMAVVAGVSPAPVADLIELLSRFRVALTVEAHYLTNGLGSLVSEIVAERNLNCRIVRHGVETLPGSISGSQAYFYRKYGLSSEALTESAQHAWNEKKLHDERL